MKPTPPDFSKMLGWQGEELPPGAQGMVIIRQFIGALQTQAANFTQLSNEITKLMQNCPPDQITDRLSANPFYRAVIERLALLPEFSDPSDELFRKNAQELYLLVRTTNSDAIIQLCIAMWVTDGADMPDQIMELAKMVDEVKDIEDVKSKGES